MPALASRLGIGSLAFASRIPMRSASPLLWDWEMGSSSSAVVLDLVASSRLARGVASLPGLCLANDESGNVAD